MSLNRHISSVLTKIRRSLRNRRYERQARSFLDSELSAKLGLKQTELLTDHFDRKIYRSSSGRGQVVIKIYHAKQLAKARAQEALYPLLVKRGLDLPELIRADTGSATANQYHIACLVFEWIDGSKLDITDPAAVRAAMENLARLHGISEDSPGALEYLRQTEYMPDFANEKFITGRINASIKHMRNASVAVSEAEEKLIRQAVLKMTGPVLSAQPPRGLIHMDYSADNLIQRKSGQLYTIDLDGLRGGCFGFDLGPALLHMAYGIRSSALTEMEIESILSAAPFGALLETYFGVAPQWAAPFWAEHHRYFMLWAYVRAMGNTAMRSRDSVRFDNRELAELHSRAQTRLRKLIHYLDG